jgi:hypothetical protein
MGMDISVSVCSGMLWSVLKQVRNTGTNRKHFTFAKIKTELEQIDFQSVSD